MSDDYVRQVQALAEQASALEPGPSKLALLEEAQRLADSHQDDELGYAVRQEIIEIGTFAGYPEKTLVAFSWCLAQADRAPEEYDEAELLWKYKWVMQFPPGFPQISRRQMDEMFADMARRFQRVGATLRPVYKLQCKAALAMGDREAGRAFQRRWRAAEVGWLSDCPACERDDQVDYLIHIGKDERALELAGPILQGRLQCAEIPHLTLARILEPLFRLGLLEEAARQHQRGYALIARNRDFLPEVARHLAFLVLTDNLARAAQLLERHLPWALETADLGRRFAFYLAARLLLERLRQRGEGTLAVRLPRTFPLQPDSGSCAVPELAAWFDDALAELAGRFNERNGNDSFTRRIADNLKLTEQVRPFPLPAGRPEP
jgi:hypothetical protein